MPLVAGSRLGNYDIIAPLGAGGMGEVYRAHDLRLGRDVAIKVLPEELAASPDRLARFEREARIVARLNHPNIVTLYSIEEAAGTRFITMELVEGRSLTDLLVPGGMPAGQVLDVMTSVADALAVAHAKGIVHRDLKPGNVMVTTDGRVKVLDFGLAKLAPTELEPPRASSATIAAPLSMVGEVLGTVPYMAPEQIFGEAIDARADVFSFGVLTFELIAGRRPFVGATTWETTAAIMRDDPPALTRLRPETPVELERAVNHCLAKQPNDRFQSAGQLATELRAIQRALQRALERGVSPAVPREPHPVASIAVLPFANRSADADDEYFSDGLADEMIGLLAKIKGLRVSARASSFAFKGRSVSAEEVGRALNVATLLDGSVRRAGSRVRISVQLVQVADGGHLWSETYDRTIDDIFAVQDDIARSVVKELRTTLLGENADSAASGRAQVEVDRAARGRSTDAEAYRLYLLARYFLDQLSRESTAKAITYLTQAVQRDPRFASAWVELSVAYVREVGWGWVADDTGFARARAAVERALELEPDLADAHAQISWIQMFHDWNWGSARMSLGRALELAPGSASAIRLSGVLATILGNTSEAIAIFRRALDHDPLSAAAYHSLGFALHAVDDHAGAEEAYRKALELAPQRVGTRSFLAQTLLAQGRVEEAADEARQEPEDGFRLCAVAITAHALGRVAASDAALRELVDKHADLWGLQVAEVHAARGDVDEAFRWLERAFERRDTGLARAKTNPSLRALHDDARWATLLERMGLGDGSAPG